AVAGLALALLAVALLAPLAVALRAPLAVALRAVLAVALRAVLGVSGIVHGARRLSSAAAVHPRNHRPEWRSPLARASPRAAGIGWGHVRRMVASHACAVGVPSPGLTSKASATMAVTAQPSLKAARSSSWRTRRRPVAPGWRSLKHIR